MASILRVHQFPGDVRRLWRIVITFLSVYLAPTQRRIQLGVIIPILHRIAPQRAAKITIRELNRPLMVRQAFEKLGPTFVKFGQILSVRPDIVPPEYIAEFEKLQSKAPPFPFPQVREIVASELGNSIKVLFQRFDSTPIAAASLAQVHVAVLPSGEKAAVKVQRPDVKRLVAQDIRLLRWLARFAERHIPGARYYRPVSIVEEFADWAMRELDFRKEGFNADHFRDDFRDDPTVYVPKVHWDFTTEKVLTMEFVDGAMIDDKEKMFAFAIDRQELARRGAHSLFRQIFLNGFFHGDPHPGNFFALRENVICYHDFGMVGFLPNDLRRELTSYFIAFTEADPEAAAEHLLHITTTLEDSNPEKFRRDLVDLIGAWHYSGRQSIARTFLQILQTGAAHRIVIPSTLALLGKALITVESVGLSLYPEFDFEKEFRPFITDVFRNRLSPKKAIQSVESGILDYAHDLWEGPKRLSQALGMIARGETVIKLDQKEMRTLLEHMQRTTAAQVIGPIGIAVIVGSAVYLHATGVSRVLGIPVTLVWLGGIVILVIWLVRILFKH